MVSGFDNPAPVKQPSDVTDEIVAEQAWVGEAGRGGITSTVLVMPGTLSQLTCEIADAALAGMLEPKIVGLSGDNPAIGCSSRSVA
ncbi:hypothetical protein OMK68_20250 [Rhodococcus pyridinivorans]|uniref:hypothetical protein n=1 Tax=Rhodococcus pyridinivorans TaxID=103816 RepID=UPI002227F2BF|nr:hypothetical protein [Rhodococcus pyridinivorans]MCW3471939.1 hypothetical protein [Rhodococcus pyridinivorans]